MSKPEESANNVPRKNAERALFESENKYRRLIEQASDAIFILDRDGLLLEVNSRACEILGCENESLLGTNLSALFAAEELAAAPLRPIVRRRKSFERTPDARPKRRENRRRNQRQDAR